MGWWRGRLLGRVETPLRKWLITVDPDAGTISLGKGRHRETRELVPEVGIQMIDPQASLARGMFGAAKVRASYPVVHVHGPGWEWKIPVTRSALTAQAYAFVRDYATWKVHRRV